MTEGLQAEAVTAIREALRKWVPLNSDESGPAHEAIGSLMTALRLAEENRNQWHSAANETAAEALDRVQQLSHRLEEENLDLREHLAVFRQVCGQALASAADKLDVIRRCAVNSRTAPNVLETIADVSLWARDDAREALAAAVVVGQPGESPAGTGGDRG